MCSVSYLIISANDDVDEASLTDEQSDPSKEKRLKSSL